MTNSFESGANVTITSDDGLTTLTGKMKSVDIRAEAETEEFSSFYSDRHFRVSERYFIEGEMQTPWKVVVKEKKSVKVERFAVLVAEDCTAPAFEAARRVAGAPEHARMRLLGNAYGELVDRALDKPQPVRVEFRWEEEV